MNENAFLSLSKKMVHSSAKKMCSTMQSSARPKVFGKSSLIIIIFKVMEKSVSFREEKKEVEMYQWNCFVSKGGCIISVTFQKINRNKIQCRIVILICLESRKIYQWMKYSSLHPTQPDGRNQKKKNKRNNT